MLRLKVAFQGGGARLVTLIAAAHVLREMEERGDVKVDLVAGTSAGSIAACMFASERPFAEQIEILRRVGPDLVKQLSSGKSIIPVEMKIAQGRPLLDENALKKLIRALFYDPAPRRSSYRLSDLRIPVHITLTDITTRTKEFATSADDREITEIISDSCALPFVFRTYKSSSNYIDGGIASNLPSDIILDSNPHDSIPLAFRFRSNREQRLANNLKEYAVSIISTAIDSAVDLSAKSVLQGGGCVCELPDHFETLDFDGALKQGLRSDQYDSAKRHIFSELSEKFAPIKLKQSRTAIALKSRSRDEVIFYAHDALMSSFPYKITETSTLVVASSLYDEGDPRLNINDQIFQSYNVTSTNNIVALRVAMPFGGAPYQDTEQCLVVDKNGDAIAVRQIYIVAKDPKGRYEAVDYILIYPNRPIEQNQLPLTVTYRTAIPHSMKDIADGEWLKSRTGDFGAGSNENHILLIPETFPHVDMGDLLEKAALLPAERKDKALRYCEQKWVKGRPLTSSEIAAILRNPTLPGRIGYRALGWVGEAVPSDNFSGVFFRTLESASR